MDRGQVRRTRELSLNRSAEFRFGAFVIAFRRAEKGAPMERRQIDPKKNGADNFFLVDTRLNGDPLGHERCASALVGGDAA